MFKKNISISTLPFGAFVLAIGAGCSSDKATVTGISSLPKASGSVTSSSVSLKDTIEFSATNGVKFKDWSTTTFQSEPMCRVGQGIRDIFREAVRPDKILCYVGAMENAGLFPNAFTGTNQYYHLTGDTALRIKFSGTKNADGAVTAFSMYECENGETTSNTNNGGYRNITIDPTTGAATVTAVGKYSFSGGGSTFTFANKVDVSGTVNSSGAWTSKTITVNHSGGDGSNTWSGNFSVVQSPGLAVLTGYDTGTYQSEGYNMSVVAYLQLLGSSVSDYAGGDGSAKVAFDNGSENTAHWNGDTTAVATSSDYASSVESATLPSIGTPDTAFGSGQSWDCQPESTFTEVAFSEIPTAAIEECDLAYSFGSDDNSYVDCSSN